MRLWGRIHGQPWLVNPLGGEIAILGLNPSKETRMRKRHGRRHHPRHNPEGSALAIAHKPTKLIPASLWAGGGGLTALLLPRYLPTLGLEKMLGRLLLPIEQIAIALAGAWGLPKAGVAPFHAGLFGVGAGTVVAIGLANDYLLPAIGLSDLGDVGAYTPPGSMIRTPPLGDDFGDDMGAYTPTRVPLALPAYGLGADAYADVPLAPWRAAFRTYGA